MLEVAAFLASLFVETRNMSAITIYSPVPCTAHRPDLGVSLVGALEALNALGFDAYTQLNSEQIVIRRLNRADQSNH